MPYIQRKTMARMTMSTMITRQPRARIVPVPTVDRGDGADAEFASSGVNAPSRRAFSRLIGSSLGLKRLPAHDNYDARLTPERGDDNAIEMYVSKSHFPWSLTKSTRTG
jgi:hypothetical protein